MGLASGALCPRTVSYSGVVLFQWALDQAQTNMGVSIGVPYWSPLGNELLVTNFFADKADSAARTCRLAKKALKKLRKKGCSRRAKSFLRSQPGSISLGFIGLGFSGFRVYRV